MRGFVATRTGTATKTDTPIIETPQSISVVTTDQVKNQGAETIGAALRYTAGVSGDVNGGSDTRFGGLQIRGFDMTMPGLYLDGLRLPSSNYVHFLGLEAYGAERLEVLKGPSSVMYGGSGTGGILNYVSKLPTAHQFGEMSVSGGSFNRYQGQFDVGGPANKEGTVLWRLTGVVRDGETQVDFTKDNRVFIAPAVTFKPNEDTSITLLANYQKDTAGWGLQFLPASGTAFANNGRFIPNTRFGGEPNFNQFDTELATAGYLLSHDINEALTFRQNLRYSWMHNAAAQLLRHRLRLGGRRSRRPDVARRQRRCIDHQLLRGRQPAAGQVRHRHPEPHHAVRHRLPQHVVPGRSLAVQHRHDQRVCARLHQHMGQSRPVRR